MYKRQPLAALKAGESVNWVDLFFGNVQGTIGETSALAILIGAAILLINKMCIRDSPCVS